MTAGQWAGWVQLAEEYGLGLKRNDIFFGQIAAILFNSNKEKSTRVRAPVEFMPYHEQPTIEMSDEEYEAKLKEIMPELFGASNIDTA